MARAENSLLLPRRVRGIPPRGLFRRERHRIASRRRRSIGDHISSRILIRSSIGGWVEKRRSTRLTPSPGFLEGWENHRCAVALLATRIWLELAAILRSAAAWVAGRALLARNTIRSPNRYEANDIPAAMSRATTTPAMPKSKSHPNRYPRPAAATRTTSTRRT